MYVTFLPINMHSYLFEICNAKYLLNIYHMYLIFQLHYIFGNPYVYFRDIWGYKYINCMHGIFACAYISSHWGVHQQRVYYQVS